MEALLTLSTNPDTGPDKEPPKFKVHRNHPLSHKESFIDGDALRATNPGLGLEQGVEYPILGYWNSEQFGMYVYIRATANAMLKCYRFAVTEERTKEEVRFYELPNEITEICIKDCLFGLEYVPALVPEVIMRPVQGGKQEETADHMPTLGIHSSYNSVA